MSWDRRWFGMVRFALPEQLSVCLEKLLCELSILVVQAILSRLLLLALPAAPMTLGSILIFGVHQLKTT